MVSRTQPSSAAVPALATTFALAVPSRLRRPSSAAPAPRPLCDTASSALSPRLCRHRSATTAASPPLCRPSSRRRSSAALAQTSPSSPRLHSSGLRRCVRGGAASPALSLQLGRPMASSTAPPRPFWGLVYGRGWRPRGRSIAALSPAIVALRPPLLAPAAAGTRLATRLDQASPRR